MNTDRNTGWEDLDAAQREAIRQHHRWQQKQDERSQELSDLIIWTISVIAILGTLWAIFR